MFCARFKIFSSVSLEMVKETRVPEKITDLSASDPTNFLTLGFVGFLIINIYLLSEIGLWNTHP